MGNRLTKICTRTGDGGTTGLGDGSRIDKCAARIIAMGDVDELNSQLGVLRACGLAAEMDELLLTVQHDLFDVGGELAIPGREVIAEVQIEFLESAVTRMNSVLPPLREFILPGGAAPAATAHVARSVCRRAERSFLHLAKDEAVNRLAGVYLNRLSDLLFVLARTLARLDSGQEVYWQPDRHSPAG